MLSSQKSDHMTAERGRLSTKRANTDYEDCGPKSPMTGKVFPSNPLVSPDWLRYQVSRRIGNSSTGYTNQENLREFGASVRWRSSRIRSAGPYNLAESKRSVIQVSFQLS